MAEHHAVSPALAVDDALLQAHPELAVLTLELPDSDGEPLNNERSGFQMRLVLDSLAHHWRARQDFYSGGNMHVKIFRRRYSSSRKPYARRWEQNGMLFLSLPYRNLKRC